MKRCRRYFGKTLILCLLLCLFGCAGGGEKQKTRSTGKEKILNFAQTQTYSSLDPVHDYDGWMVERCGVGETLTRFDETMTARGWLAEDDFSVSQDGLSWTFTIKDNVNFSNGTKLTADLARASLERVFDASARAVDFFDLESMEASGQTLVINTKTPCPVLPGMLADPAFVILDTTGDLSEIGDKGPICTGPFVYESFEPVTMALTVVKNERYWNGDVNLDRVNFIQYSDPSSMNLSLQNGEVDAAYGLSPQDISSYESSEAYTVEKCVGARTDFGFMNQNGLLKDKELRIALLECLDMETICSVQLNGMYSVGNTPFPSENYGRTALKNPYTYDLSDAKKRLKKAGYEDRDGDGVIETPEGKQAELSLYTYTTRAELPTICEALQYAAGQLGITINIHTVEDLWSTVMPGGDYDLVVLNSSAISTGDPEAFLKQYFVTGGVYNKHGYSNQQVDDLTKELSETFGQKEREKLVRNISEILMEDACCAFYSYPMTAIVTKKSVTGLKCTMADYYWMTSDVDIK